MPKKLTDKVKARIKKAKGKVKASDYSGEALRYLKNYRQLQAARQAKTDAVLRVGETKIPKNSELYRTIAEAAKIKGQAVAQFAKENVKAIEAFSRKGSITITRETDYVIKDIQALPKGKKIFLNSRSVSKTEAIYAVQRLQMISANYSNIVVLLFEVRYDLKGNMYLDIPSPADYDDMIDDLDDMEDSPEDEAEKDLVWSDFLDKFDSIHYIKS